MERVEGARTPYEIYCFHCRVTFPPEARRCLHCGGPLFGAGERAGTGRELASGPALPLPTGENTEEGAVTMARRFAGLAVWTLVALSALLSHLCQRA